MHVAGKATSETPSESASPDAAGPARPVPASGPARAMHRLGLVRDIDLALHLPLRYEDETRLSRLARLRDGEAALVEGVVQDSRIEARGRRQLLVRLQEDAAEDGSPGGELTLRFLNFHAGQQRQMACGTRLRVRGELRGGFLGREMVHPVVRAVVAGEPLPASLTPVYPTSAGLPQAYLRKAVASGLHRAVLAEVLPPEAIPAGLPPLKEALRFLHHPPPGTDLEALHERSHPAWQRLKYDELLAQQISQQQARVERGRLTAPALRVASGGGLYEALLGVLPFALTGAQQRVVEEIASDLAGGPAGVAGPGAGDTTRPMHRLLQGDVGAGKTVVAALAAAVAIDAGWQCALMAPTEILAEQHFRKLVDWLLPLLEARGRTVAWLTGSRKGKARTQMVERVASGEAALVVGTHAVIQDDVHYARLGLAIVDEQHRFGVHQRLALRRKLAGGLEPHLLMMSATPIPRTLAMSYYADLDVSTIDELPPGRTPIVTKVFVDGRREEIVARIRDEAAGGRQAYWVCPLIEEAEEPPEARLPKEPPPAAHAREQPALRNVIETHAMLEAALPGLAVGLVHGRLKAADKAAVMARFSSGELAVLVATTVIEVGVDVPNASLMVIEHAERFGLSQLHQLRGRVGRGAQASACVLLYSPPLSDAGKQRLKAMVETTDGFEIARRDLAIRGPGEFMGERQSGDAMLRFADLQQDDALLRLARQAAPALLRDHPQAAARHVSRWLGTKAELLKA